MPESEVMIPSFERASQKGIQKGRLGEAAFGCV
jgi:hypothetical protein